MDKNNIEEVVSYSCDVLIRSTSSWADYISSLDAIANLLQNGKCQAGVSQTLFCRGVLERLNNILAQTVDNTTQFHTSTSIKLAELCLLNLLLIIPKLEPKRATEKHFSCTVLSILQLLGFGDVFKSGRFKHSFPSETLKFLQNGTDGKIFESKAHMLDTAEKLQIRKQLTCSSALTSHTGSTLAMYDIDILGDVWEVEVAGELLDKGLAAVRKKSTGSKRPSAMLSMKILTWEKENILWAHILTDEHVAYQNALKNASWNEMVPLREEPKKGDIVCARYDGLDRADRCWYRALVLESQENIYLFSVDYGFLCNLHWTRLYSLPKSAGEIPYLAVACRLPNLIPPMPSPEIVSLGLQVLSGLCDHDSDMVASLIVKSKNIPTVLDLAEHLTSRNYKLHLELLFKLCMGKSQIFCHILLENQGLLKFDNYFRWVHAKWLERPSDYVEECLFLCCKILQRLVSLGSRDTSDDLPKVDIERVKSLCELRDIPTSCMKVLAEPASTQRKADYAQGDIFKVQENHIIIDSRSFREIDFKQLEEKIVALANNPNGGQIAFGISSSVVVGMHLTQKKRDMFRIAISDLTMHRITPPITSEKCTLNFMPVEGLSSDMFLADLQIIGTPFGHHSTGDGRYMVYLNYGTVREMSPNELQSAVAKFEEARYLQEIRMLGSAINRLKSRKV